MLEDVLKSRPYTRLFVQSEVLQKKSIDEAYKSFCNILGDDAMEYHEFDYWYHHFVNGNFDLDYERKTEQKPLELADMPIDAVRKIVEKLKPIEKCIFRNVSQKCREIVDKKSIIIDTVYLRDDDWQTSVSFDNHSFEYGVNKFNEVVPVERHEEHVKYDEVNKEKIDLECDKKEECEKRVVQMLAFALNNPKVQIRKLHFSIKEQTLVDKLDTFFKSLTHQLHVEAFYNIGRQEHFQKNSEEINLMKYLPHLKPGTLKSIEVFESNPLNWDLNPDLKKLAELEQWKQAKQFDTVQAISDNIDKVAHFDYLSAYLDDNCKPEHVITLKNLYINSPTFKLCELWADKLDVERIREALGGDRFPMADGSTLYVDVALLCITFTRQ